MIKLISINKVYPNGTQALTNINIEFESNEFVFIVGRSGSGKSTLLNIIGCIDNFESGRYLISGDNISSYSMSDLDKLRNYHFGFVFQEYLLLDTLSVYDNIRLALDIQRNSINDIMVERVMKQVDIYDLKDRLVSELSGGQKQRVAIARALVKSPSIILADEPTGNLDEKTSEQIYELLKTLSRDYLVIIVSHDLKAAHEYADRIIELEDSHIINDSTCNNETYCIHYSDGTSKSDLSKADISNEIARQENDDITFNITKSRKNINNADKSKIELRKPESNHSVFLTKVLKYSMLFFKENKKRIITSIFVLLLASFLLIISLYVSFYDPNTTISDYTRNYNILEYTLYEEVQYVDEFSVKKSKIITKGAILKHELEKSFDVVTGYKNTQMNSLEGKYLQVSVGYISSNTMLDKYSISLNDGEIVITDYILDKLGVNGTGINETLVIENMEYIIKGVLSTDYVEYDLESKLLDKNYYEYATYRLQNDYSVCYVLDSNLMSPSHENIILKSSDFFFGNRNNDYYNSVVEYGDISNSPNINLLWGVLPDDDNEVIVSSSFANYHGINQLDDYITMSENTYLYKDLSNNKYNHFYQDIINLYEYFQEGVKVVGIYDSGNAHVLMNHAVYERISTDYYQYYYFDYFRSTNNSFDINIINVLKTYKLDEPNARTIYHVYDIIYPVEQYSFVVSILVLLMIFFFSLTNVYSQARQQKRNIGILKTLGMFNKDIYKIFLFESLILSSITIILSLLFANIAFIIVNQLAYNSISENPFVLIYFNLPVSVFVIVFIYVVIMLSSLVSIKKVLKKKPMISIRESN